MNCRITRSFLIVSALVLLVASQAFAGTIAYDDFNTTTGTGGETAGLWPNSSAPPTIGTSVSSVNGTTGGTIAGFTGNWTFMGYGTGVDSSSNVAVSSATSGGAAPGPASYNLSGQPGCGGMYFVRSNGSTYNYYKSYWRAITGDTPMTVGSSRYFSFYLWPGLSSTTTPVSTHAVGMTWCFAAAAGTPSVTAQFVPMQATANVNSNAGQFQLTFNGVAGTTTLTATYASAVPYWVLIKVTENATSDTYSMYWTTGAPPTTEPTYLLSIIVSPEDLDGQTVQSAQFIDVNPGSTEVDVVSALRASSDFNSASPSVIPTINSFSASPTSIIPGGSSSLGWTTTNANTVSINQGVGNVTPAAGGSANVSPTTTTTYTLSATAGGTATATATVFVNAPSIDSFTATPTTIVSGQSSTLAWTTTNAATTSIDNGIGSVTPVASGNTSVSPTTTTTYTLTAVNSQGTPTTATATVTVVPVLTITPNTTTLVTGQSQQFTTNLTGATWTATGGTVSTTGLYTAGSTAGSYSVTATTSNPTQTATAAVTVPVSPLLVTPANGSTGIALPPTVTWQAVTGATSYTVDVSTSTAFPTTGLNEQTGVTATSACFAALAPNTQYYWRVEVTGGVWSAIWSFTTGADTPPQALYRSDAAHTGRYAATGPSTPFERWKYNLGGTATGSSPVVDAGGFIYVGSSDKNVYALNPDGTKKWTFATGNTVASSAAIGGDGTVYIGTGDDTLFALTPTGMKKWTYVEANNLLQNYVEAPTIGPNGMIYFGANSLHAFNLDGTAQWTSGYLPYGLLAPALGSNGSIYVPDNTLCLHAYGSNGANLWQHNEGGGDNDIASATVATDGTVYCWDEAAFFAFTADGAQRWNLPGIKGTAALAADGTLYLGSGALYAYTPAGMQKWAFTGAGSTFKAAPIVDASGTIFAVDTTGNCYAVNPDGTQKWVLALGSGMSSPQYLGASPALGPDGTLYIVTDDGMLHAIITGLTITPTTIGLLTGQTQQFTTNLPGTTWAASGGDAAKLSVYASRTKAGATVLVAVNKTPDPMPLEIQLKGITAGASARVFQITAPAPTPQPVGTAPVDGTNVLTYTLPAYSATTLEVPAK